MIASPWYLHLGPAPGAGQPANPDQPTGRAGSHIWGKRRPDCLTPLPTLPPTAPEPKTRWVWPTGMARR
jgi:hypothetical protein